MSKKNIIVFVFLILLVAVFWFWQSGSYSKEVLKLEIIGSDTADLGEKIEYVVKFKNNGNVRLENPELIFEYPEHAIVEDYDSRIIRMSSSDLGGDIYPGEERVLTFSARLLGKEKEVLTAKASISFQPKDLTTKNQVSTTFATVLDKIPLTLNLDLASKIEAGKSLSFRVNYLSNVDYPLTDLSCQIEYPDEFEFSQSDPEALDQTQWDISVLNEADGGRIEIWGTLRGEVGDQKNFKVKLGIWKDDEFILLKEVTKGIEIIAPSLYIWQQINGNPQYIASVGDYLHYEIYFRNVGEDPLTDLVLISRLSSQGFDFYSIQSPEGNYQSGDNSIIWEGRNVPKLQYLGPNEEGKVEFWINLKEGEWPFYSLADKNPELKNVVVISQAREEFSTKVNSLIEGEQKAVFGGSDFENSGPYPVEAGKETKFTIKWTIKNYFNDVENVKMKTQLPENVNFTGKVWSSDENVNLTYDSASREVVWDIGEIEAGSGILNEEKYCAFQLSIIPDQQDAGNQINLLKQSTISGDDKFTGNSLNYQTGVVNTNIK